MSIDVASVKIKDYKYIEKVGRIPPEGWDIYLNIYNKENNKVISAWTICLIITSIDSSGVVYGKMAYLCADKGPKDILKKGQKVELFGGSEYYGTAELLSSIDDGEKI